MFDKYSDLQWRDVELFKNSVKICIKSSKTSGAKPVFVQLGKLTDKKLCPRHAVKQLMSLQKEKGIFAKNLPVFRKGGGQKPPTSRPDWDSGNSGISGGSFQWKELQEWDPFHPGSRSQNF